jgi:hypothetical protein
MINEAVILTKIAAEGRAQAGTGLRINGVKYMVRFASPCPALL